ncbi:MAG: ATP-binding cassette domain-containing protein [Myxococcota bacterium]
MLTVDVKYTLPGESGQLAVSFAAPPGITALVGPSGAGKSTTLALVAGLARPDAGRIALGDTVFFDSASQVDLTPDRRRVGLVFQSLALFPHLSARDNVAFGIAAPTRSERASRAQRWLARCEVGHVGDRRPWTLSGGEAQRVALARALASEPRLLLLDEPFSALDADLRGGLRDTVAREVAAAGIPGVLVTHDRADALALASWAVVMQRGAVVRSGPTREVLAPTASAAPPET